MNWKEKCSLKHEITVTLSLIVTVVSNTVCPFPHRVHLLCNYNCVRVKGTHKLMRSYDQIGISMNNFGIFLISASSKSPFRVAHESHYPPCLCLCVCVLALFLSISIRCRFKLLTPYSLAIYDVGRRDKGMYQCLVANKESSAQAVAELKLGGKSNWKKNKKQFHYTLNIFLCTMQIQLNRKNKESFTIVLESVSFSFTLWLTLNLCCLLHFHFLTT